MTSWMKERDRLVEQTRAFVQGVAAAHPIQARKLAATPPSPAEAASAPALPVTAPAPVAAATPAAQIQVAPPQAVPVLPMQPLPSIGSERDAITKRVAAFRAHQDRLIRERETYYATVQAKIRDVLGNEI